MCKAPPPGGFVVDGDQRLRSRTDDSYRFAVDDVYAVMLLWSDRATVGWEGWLTTGDHRAMRFSAEELGEAAFQRWLARLPGWYPDRLVHALGNPGLHLVWRHPTR